MRRLSIVLLALAALLTPAQATVVRRLDLRDLVAGAGAIVQGRCLAVRTERLTDGLIVTRVTLAVERDYLSANGPERLEFLLPGGELGDVALIVPGMPAFELGEELFLFLSRPSSRGLSVPLGLGQGKLRIVHDAATGTRRLQRSLEGLDFVDPISGLPGPAPPDGGLSLAAFRADVERLVDEVR